MFVPKRSLTQQQKENDFFLKPKWIKIFQSNPKPHQFIESKTTPPLPYKQAHNYLAIENPQTKIYEKSNKVI